MERRISMTREGKPWGELMCREEPLRVVCSVTAPQAPGIVKVWITGDMGELLLGTLSPEGERLSLSRTLSRNELGRVGIRQITGARAVTVVREPSAESCDEEPRRRSSAKVPTHSRSESPGDFVRTGRGEDELRWGTVGDHNINYVNKSEESNLHKNYQQEESDKRINTVKSMYEDVKKYEKVNNNEKYVNKESAEHADVRWQPLSQLDIPITDPDIRNALRRELPGFWRREGRGITVCFPWREGQPFPIPELVCFSRISRGPRGLSVSVSFSEKWWPLV